MLCMARSEVVEYKLPKGRKWSDKLNQHEVDVLWEVGRLRCDFKEKPTADEVNRKEKDVTAMPSSIKILNTFNTCCIIF